MCVLCLALFGSHSGFNLVLLGFPLGSSCFVYLGYISGFIWVRFGVLCVFLCGFCLGLVFRFSMLVLFGFYLGCICVVFGFHVGFVWVLFGFGLGFMLALFGVLLFLFSLGSSWV